MTAPAYPANQSHTRLWHLSPLTLWVTYTLLQLAYIGFTHLCTMQSLLVSKQKGYCMHISPYKIKKRPGGKHEMERGRVTPLLPAFQGGHTLMHNSVTLCELSPVLLSNTSYGTELSFRYLRICHPGLVTLALLDFPSIPLSHWTTISR